MKNFKFALFSLCSLMVLTPSCSSDSEETPAVPEVGNFGEIKFDREKFGLGQTITASCQLPTTSTYISDLTYSWYVNGELLDENTASNGTSNITFTLPSPIISNVTPGDYKIELKASTTTTEAKLPAPATATFKTQYTDTYLSFWGDNVELTKKNVAGLTGSNGIYTVTMKDYLLQDYAKQDMQATYSFTDNKLSKVDETHSITIKNSQLGEFFSVFKAMMKRTLRCYNITETQSIISFDDQTQKDFNYNSDTYNKDDFELDIFVLGGKITIHAENDNTELVISAVGKTGETPSDYAIDCTFTYTPKN